MVKPEQEKIKAKMNKDLEDYRVQVKMYDFINSSDQSKAANKLRLQKLKTKIEFVEEVMKETRTRLAEKITKNPNDYKNVLKNLIVQVKREINEGTY